MLPDDFERATLVGRIWTDQGPTPVAVIGGRLRDISGFAPTISDTLEQLEPGVALPTGPDLGPVADQGFTRAWVDRDEAGRSVLLTPVDLQCVKAAGVTFAASALERVIEERARGDAALALDIRAGLQERIGADLRSVNPGSEAAAHLKSLLIADGLWSQYLEVAIGPDAEIFTKAPVLSSMGWGQTVGVRSDSEWNNPEPEIVLACDSQGRTRGASLGNDVNLRDFEGRSALLLGKAKDNNAACAIGPFIRLFDDDFTLDHVREAVVSLEIEGKSGYRLKGSSSMALISRDPLELVNQTIGKHHQYPDGMALFLGTMFAPVEDRDIEGRGFTHHEGDVVRVRSPLLGTLENKVTACELAPRWEFGVSALMKNLSARNLIRH